MKVSGEKELNLDSWAASKWHWIAKAGRNGGALPGAKIFFEIPFVTECLRIIVLASRNFATVDPEDIWF